MKRFLSIFTAFLLCLALCACGESQPEVPELSEEVSAAVYATWQMKDHLEQSLKIPTAYRSTPFKAGKGAMATTSSR